MTDVIPRRWLAIPGFEDLYSVSDDGLLRNRSGKILRAGPSGNGYRMVTLCKDGKRYPQYVHHLVMLTFVGPRPAGQETRHLDGDRLNNRLENLAYGTSRENNLDIVRHGRNHNANKTHCDHGHEFTPENTRATDRQRTCRECATEIRRQQDRSEARKEARNRRRRALTRARHDEAATATHCAAGHELTPNNIFLAKGGYPRCRACWSEVVSRSWDTRRNGSPS